MKKSILSVLLASGFAIASNFAIASEENALLKIEQPTPVEKVYHLLDAEYDFKLYTKEGKLIMQGKRDKVDITELEPETYLLSYNGKVEYIVVPDVGEN